MSVMTQICVLFAICLAGEAVSAVLPIPMPASVLSMVILLILLGLRLLKPKQLQAESDFLLNNMALFFVPANVGILRYKDAVLSNFWPIFLISLLTTPLVFFVTGHVVQLTMKLLRRKEAKRS